MVAPREGHRRRLLSALVAPTGRGRLHDRRGSRSPAAGARAVPRPLRPLLPALGGARLESQVPDRTRPADRAQERGEHRRAGRRTTAQAPGAVSYTHLTLPTKRIV